MKVILTGLVLLSSVVAQAKCDCPNQEDAVGNRCGRRAAYCKPGGKQPSCPGSTISDCSAKRSTSSVPGTRLPNGDNK